MITADVLPIFKRPSEKDFRLAVARIIAEIKRETGFSNRELGEKIGVCAVTVKNAEYGHNNLSPVTLACIAHAFGEDAIAPYMDLWRGRFAEPETVSDRFDEIMDCFVRLRRVVGA